MTWYPAHDTLAQHPKTNRARRQLDVSAPTMVGHLHVFWAWCVRYAPDGKLARFDDGDIADGAMWDGDAAAFVAALTNAGFLNADRTVHDWDDYGGKLHQKRQDDAGRKRRSRDAQGTSGGRPPDVRVTAHVEKSRVEDKRVEERRAENVARDATTVADAPQAPKASRPAPKSRPTTIPDGFAPTEAMLAWADAKPLAPAFVALETEKFREHFTATGKTMTDWAAAWRTWMLRSLDYAARGAANGRASPNGRPQSVGDRNEANIAEFLRRNGTPAADAADAIEITGRVRS